MAKFDMMKGLFGLLPTPYTDDLEIHTEDLKRVANFCCESGQHGIVWPVMVGEFYFLGESERIPSLDDVLDEVNKHSRVKVKEIYVDGGASRNAFLMQFQADLLQIRLIRRDTDELTVMGAQYLGGLAVGLWTDVSELQALKCTTEVYEPQIDRETALRKLLLWREAVKKIL